MRLNAIIELDFQHVLMIFKTKSDCYFEKHIENYSNHDILRICLNILEK